MKLPVGLEKQLNPGLVCNLLEVLGNNSINQKKFKEAISYYELQNNILNQDDPDPAMRTRVNLQKAYAWAQLHETTRSNQIIEELFSEICKQAQGNPGADSRQAAAFYDIAMWQYKMNQHKASEKTLETALSIVKRNLPTEVLRAKHKMNIHKMEYNLAELKEKQKVSEWENCSSKASSRSPDSLH